MLVLTTLFYNSVFHTPMPKMGSCILAGLFVTFLSKIIIQSFVDVVFHSTDGLLYCYVLEAESGKGVSELSEDLMEIHAVIQDSKSDAESAELAPVKPAEATYG